MEIRIGDNIIVIEGKEVNKLYEAFYEFLINNKIEFKIKK